MSAAKRRQKVTKLDLLATNEAVRNIFVSEGLRVVKKDFTSMIQVNHPKKDSVGPMYYVLHLLNINVQFISLYQLSQVVKAKHVA